MNENKIIKENYYNKEKLNGMIQVLEKDFKETIVNIKDEFTSTQTHILSNAKQTNLFIF